MTHFGGEILLLYCSGAAVGWHRLPAFPEEEWGEDRTLQGSREGYATFAMTVTQPRGIFARYLAVGVDRGEGG